MEENKVVEEIIEEAVTPVYNVNGIACAVSLVCGTALGIALDRGIKVIKEKIEEKKLDDVVLPEEAND